MGIIQGEKSIEHICMKRTSTCLFQSSNPDYLPIQAIKQRLLSHKIKSDIMMCVIRTNNCYVQSMVKLTNARNVQLHISYNGMGNSECEVEIVKAFNSTVHLSFQVQKSQKLIYHSNYCYWNCPKKSLSFHIDLNYTFC